MAILHYSGCQVLVNDVPAQEFDSDDNDAGLQQPGVVTKYIEAVSGEEFSIRVSLLPTWECSTEVVWRIFLDGRKSTGVFVGKEVILRGETWWVRKGEISGDGTDCVMRNFKFADLVSMDLPLHMSASEMKARYSSLGQIRVDAYRFETTVEKPAQHKKRSLESVDTRAIPEKALKGQALTLATSLGEAKKTTCGHTRTGEYLDKKPFESFVFLYRSRQALQQLMIIPRSPTPTPLEDRPIDELTVEEARELLRRRTEAAVHKKKEVKPEAKPNLKRERRSTVGEGRARKVARTADGKEYIDLLDDSEDDHKKEAVDLDEDSNGTKTKVEVIDLLD